METTRHLTTSSNLDDVVALLKELGVQYDRIVGHPDYEALSVPGYGIVDYQGGSFLVSSSDDSICSEIVPAVLERELRATFTPKAGK